ncbi:hypothetical protein Tco_0817217 [Tanacetum coccineum]
MLHLVIHLPIEALEGGPIRPRWMYPFERYMKKLKGYVRNKAKPEGSIAEGYVAEEALTFSSHYFRDVTTKFNHPNRNVDPPPPTCRFQVFRLVCKPIGLRSFIRFDAQELKKVKWYVLHNNPEIDTYRSQFKSPRCEVVVHKPRERRTTQKTSALYSPGLDEEMYYGQLQEIIEFKYLLFKVALFRVKWFDTSNKERKVKKLVLRNNMTQIDCSREAFKDDQYILVTQVKQVFYLEDKTKPHWKVVEHVNHKKFSDEGVIVVEDDPDIIHFDNSSDLPLSTTVVDVPPDIIDVPNEDDDIISDEDALPHDLADSDVEDLINVDDDTDVARFHGVYGGGDDRKVNDKTQIWAVGSGQGDPKNPNTLRSHAAHGILHREVVRSVSLYYPSWEKVPKERKAAIISKIGLHLGPQADMESPTDRDLEDQLRLQKPTIPTRLLFKAKLGRQTHTEEMKRLEATGEYTEDEINALARGGKLRGHIPGVGRVLRSQATSRPSMPAPDKSLKSMHRKVDFMMSLFEGSKFRIMFKELVGCANGVAGVVMTEGGWR